MAIYLGKMDKNLKNVWMIEGMGLSSNIYILLSSKITLIDTGIGNEKNRISPHLERLGLEMEDITEVILTHNHMDHVLGLKEIFKRATPVVRVHQDDSGPIGQTLSKRVDLKRLKGGELIDIGFPLKVIHTPGHTDGCICLYNEKSKSLFSGDTIFSGGGFGRTDLGGNMCKMIDSLEGLTHIPVKNLLPGHSEPVFEDGDSHIGTAYEMAKGLGGQN